MLRIGGDLRWPAGTGIGLVQRELLARIPEELQVQPLGIEGGIGSPLSAFRVGTACRRGRAQGLEGFWSPGFVPPAFGRVSSVVTVHDLTHRHFYSRAHRIYYDTILRPLYKRCDAVICVSNATRDEFLEWSGVAPDRVHVVYNGVGVQAAADNSVAMHCRDSSPYIFYPGNHRSYKNLERLVKAYAQSRLPSQGIRLVLTGSNDPGLISLAARLRCEGLVSFCGSLSSQELVSAYRNALVVAFVSLYEGFGLPILEGMAAGVPVVTSNVSAMPEVAGDAALKVSPYHEDQIKDALEKASFDKALRTTLIQAGFARSRLFSWDVAAEKVWKIVKGINVSS